MIIYLGQLLPAASSELPNLLLHRAGFTTSPRHRGTKDVADYSTPSNFSRFSHKAQRATWDSIVSAALSLGFKSVLLSREQNHTSLFLVAVSDCPRSLYVAVQGVSGLSPQHLSQDTRQSSSILKRQKYTMFSALCQAKILNILLIQALSAKLKPQLWRKHEVLFYFLAGHQWPT